MWIIRRYAKPARKLRIVKRLRTNMGEKMIGMMVKTIMGRKYVLIVPGAW